MTGFQDKMIQGSYATKLKFCPATHLLTRVETCQVHAVKKAAQIAFNHVTAST